MTNQKKNDNTTGTTGTQSNQGNVGSKTGQGKDFNQQKGQQGSQGSQMGGKNPPAGGPETFESDQVNQGKGQERTTQGGSQSGRGDPYPPVNPDRPMMAGGQQGGQGNLQGGGYGGNVAGGDIGLDKTGKGAIGGSEEEE